MNARSSGRADVTVTVHPAERRQAPGTVAPSCACCSCCCCCLHTIGGLVGGIMGSVATLREPQTRPRLEELDSPYAVRRDEFEEENLLPAQLVYWFAVVVMICMTCMVCYLLD